jgi:hypothetical protein
MDLDLASIFTASVVGIPLIFVVIGMVDLMKRFRNKAGEQAISGNWLLIFSLWWGVILGGLYMVARTRPPAGDWWVIFVYWFGVIIYGLALGLLASLFYDLLKGMIDKLVQRQIEKAVASQNLRIQ